MPVQNGSAETIAETLEERVFCYLKVLERIHTDQEAQFELKLMAELCARWGVRKSHTIPYHPQANGVVERGNRDLGDMLRSMLLGRDEEDWDLLLSQIMCIIRASPHKQTGETANFMMLERETRLPKHLMYGPAADGNSSSYAAELANRMEAAHDKLRAQQLQIRQGDRQKEPSFKAGSWFG